MASIPLELPLKPSEAAALADLIFQHADGRPLTDDVRNRLAPRLVPLELESMIPYLGSLQKDPVHSSAYYIAVDGLRGETSQPLLLHLALASSPASALFPESILIGRMRPGGGREVVVNAIQFGPKDTQNIRKFTEQIDRAFMTRPQGARAALVVETDSNENAATAAFDAFRTIQRNSWGNLAAIRGDLDTAMWAAIRAGWREGFAAEAPVIEAASGLAAAKNAVLAARDYTRFAVRCEMTQLTFAEEVFDFVQAAKAESSSWKYFDFEIVLMDREPTTPQQLATAGDMLKTDGRAAQLIAPRLVDSEDIQELTAQVSELAVVARQLNVTLSFDFTARGVDAGLLQAIGRACAGRCNVKMPGTWKPSFLGALPSADESDPPHKQAASYLIWAVENLRS